ncbi:MAG: hypothetical protein N4A59_12255 [Marinifilum sp.]|jgi:hypothetical protein|nr:hypothetical protein [Marinifilum sp.]
MKQFKGLFVLLVGLIAFSGSAFAQQTQDVTVGSKHDYTANPDAGTTPKEYKWQILNGSNVEVIDLSGEKNATVSITFDNVNFTPGQTYQLRTQVIDNNNCISEAVFVDITVQGEASVMFADAADNINAITCSLLAGDPTANTDFDVVFTGGVAPFELTYEVTDKDGAKTTQKKTFNTATGTISAADFENKTTGSQTVTLTLISATTKDSQPVSVKTGNGATTGLANNVRTLTVRPKPVITNLTLN